MFQFAWNPAKAASNLRKHKVSFDLACEVFQDPHLLSVLDEEHHDFEERWITMGRIRAGRLLVVCHTEAPIEGNMISIRLITARVATPNERHQYETGE